MSGWLRAHPRLADLVAGIAVAAALALLVAEQLRDKSAGAGAGNYYSQF